MVRRISTAKLALLCFSVVLIYSAQLFLRCDTTTNEKESNSIQIKSNLNLQPSKVVKEKSNK